MNCIDIGGESCALIADGCFDPTLRVWDPRKPGTHSTYTINLHIVNPRN